MEKAFIIARHSAKTQLRRNLVAGILSVLILVSILSISLILKSVHVNSVLVSASPFTSVMIIFAMGLMLFLSLNVGFTLLREKEMGILEGVFQGPIEIVEYVFGKVFGNLSVSLVFGFGFALTLFLVSMMTGLALAWELAWVFLLVLAGTFYFSSFGVLISCFSKNSRIFLIYFILINTLIGLFSLGVNWLYRVFSSENITFIYGIGKFVKSIETLFRWTTPNGLFFQGLDGLKNGNYLLYGVVFLLSIILAVLCLLLSVHTLKKDTILP